MARPPESSKQSDLCFIKDSLLEPFARNRLTTTGWHNFCFLSRADTSVLGTSSRGQRNEEIEREENHDYQ
jgi:hypothetical protein